MNDNLPLDWAQLVRLEPRLGQLRLDCRFADRHGASSFDPQEAWFGSSSLPGLKQRLDHLVGASADVRDPLITTQEAYDLASAECYQALPPSRLVSVPSSDRAIQ